MLDKGSAVRNRFLDVDRIVRQRAAQSPTGLIVSCRCASSAFAPRAAATASWARNRRSHRAAAASTPCRRARSSGRSPRQGDRRSRFLTASLHSSVRTRVRYASLKAKGYPVGSGVVEAANKVLVNQRMKRAGQRRSVEGGQNVLTFRAMSGRFGTASDDRNACLERKSGAGRRLTAGILFPEQTLMNSVPVHPVACNFGGGSPGLAPLAQMTVPRSGVAARRQGYTGQPSASRPRILERQTPPRKSLRFAERFRAAGSSG